MSNLFLSYASEDRDRVRPLADLLAQAGHSVWWDQRLNPGAEFQQEIDTALAQADRVLVLWSRQSIASSWVQAEASEGLERGILMPILLEDVKPPLPFRQRNAARLTHWQDDPDDPEVRRLLRGIEDQTGPANRGALPGEGPARAPAIQRWVVGALALVAITALCAVLYQQRVDAPAADTAQASIAITEIVNGDTGERDYLGYGFAGQVRDLLSRVNGIAVASRTATEALAGKDPRSMADLLRVRYLLEGTVSGTGERFRLDLKLVDSSTGFRIWTERYNGDLERLLELAYETSRRILETLRIDVDPRGPLNMASRITANPEALDEYLIGIDLLRRPPDESVLQRAQAHFEAALAADPTFASANAGLCQVLLERYQGSRSAEQFEAGRAQCLRSLELDANQVSARIALGKLNALSGRFTAAATDYQTALEQSPLQPEPVVGLGQAYAAVQDDKTGERWFQKAIRDFPGYPEAHTAYGGFLFSRGRIQEAANAFEQVVALFPKSATAYSDLGAAYLLLGRFDKSLDAWERAQQLEENALAWANTGTAHFLLNDLGSARKAYEAAAALNPDDYRYQSLLGDACRMLEDSDCAARAFENTVAKVRKRLQINPSDASAHSMLAMGLAHLGDADGARKHRDQAMALAPEDFYVRYDLAVAELRLGRLAAARSQLEAAMQLGYPEVLAAADPQLQSLAEQGDVIRQGGGTQ